MRDDSLRHRYEEMRNGMVGNGLEAHSKGKETQVEAAKCVAKAKQSIFERKEILQ